MKQTEREVRVWKRGRWRKKGEVEREREREEGRRDREREGKRGGQFASAALQGQCEHRKDTDGPKLSTITYSSQWQPCKSLHWTDSCQSTREDYQDHLPQERLQATIGDLSGVIPTYVSLEVVTQGKIGHFWSLNWFTLVCAHMCML